MPTEAGTALTAVAGDVTDPASATGATHVAAADVRGPGLEPGR